MRLGKDIFLLCHKVIGIFYHKENDAVLMEEVCNDCSKKVSKYIDVFTYSHSESV